MHLTSRATGPERIVPDFGQIKPRYTRVVLLCLTFKWFCRFLVNQRPYKVPPFPPPTKYRRPLFTPHSTPYEQHTYLTTHLRRDTYRRHIYTNLHHGHRQQRVSCIRNRGRLDLSDDGGASSGRRDAGRYVCCWRGVVWDVEGGGGLSVRRHSFRGHRVELWRASGWPKTTKPFESQAE